MRSEHPRIASTRRKGGRLHYSDPRNPAETAHCPHCQPGSCARRPADARIGRGDQCSSRRTIDEVAGGPEIDLIFPARRRGKLLRRRSDPLGRLRTAFVNRRPTMHAAHRRGHRQCAGKAGDGPYQQTAPQPGIAAAQRRTQSSAAGRRLAWRWSGSTIMTPS